MLFFIIISLLILILFVKITYLNKDYYVLSLCKRVKTVDGSDLEGKVPIIPGNTILGNNCDILNVSMYQYCRKNYEYSKGKSYLLHFLYSPVYNIVNAEDAEEFFQSTTLITKGFVYNLIQPFLGTGLLTSTGQKWHSRRKMLTPAFHFNILQSFLEVFKEESHKFIERVEPKIGRNIILADIIPEFTLNNVCETALGVKLDKISGSREYRHSIHDIEAIIIDRISNPLMFYNIVFKLFGKYKEHVKGLKIAHDFSSKIVQKKREEYRKNQAVLSDNQTDEFGHKKRYAMLDTLLDAEAKGLIDHQGICEEVNTFMFEGYDTTSTCLTFALFNLAAHPNIQEKCFQEVKDLDETSRLTIFDYNKLEYIECVIKETLRLYPSVPFLGRMCMTETIMNGLILPTNTQINLHANYIMRDPRHFPNPNKFDPSRFFPENTINRHPFAFIPFSAGARNCIGQKFAILEIKVLLSAIIKNYKVLPVTQLEDLSFEYGLILRTLQPIEVKLVKRS